MENIYAIVENGVVVNVGVADGLWPFPEQNAILISSGQAAVGWSYVNGQFVPPEDPPLSIVPQVVSRFQARAALYGAGLLSQVEALMADPSTPFLAKLAWEDAQEFKRNSPTIAAMAAALGLTSEQLDQLFITAAEIDA